jgi:5-(carboxyamino)imidazole ribonucleotide mutase
VPVATVSIGGARNAGLLAVRILASGEGDEATRLRAAMAAFQVDLQGQADGKGERLRAQTSARPSVGFSV